MALPLWVTLAFHAQVGRQQSCMVVVVYPLAKLLAEASSLAVGSAWGRPWLASLQPVTRVKLVGHSTRLARTFQLRWYMLSGWLVSMQEFWLEVWLIGEEAEVSVPQSLAI